MSRQKKRKRIREELEQNGVDVTEEQVNAIAEAEVRKEIVDGVQTIQYQILTLLTTNGQTPFVSVFMYLDEVPEGQTRDDLALIIEETLKQRILGVKNEKGVYITPAFPKLLYVLDEDNVREGTKYWYLTQLAAKCTAKRMVPDYISAKIMNRDKGEVYGCMGCVDGTETITYMLEGRIIKENFSDAWERLSHIYEVKVQPNGRDLYMDTDGLLIRDHKAGGFIKNYRMIRNLSDKWVKVKFDNGLILLCTEDHPFDTENRGEAYASELTVEDIVSMDLASLLENEDEDTMFMDRQIYSETAHVISVEKVERKDFSYDVTTETGHFTVSGIWSHNCRSFLTVEDGVRNPDGTRKFYGRFNQGVVTINLPHVALSSGGDMGKFWEIFKERLELCHRALRCRHERLLGTVSDVAPILWQHGALARLKKGETIDKLLYGGYSTISLGYAGLYECVKYMTGVSHTDPKGKPFALEVMQKLNDKCKEWREAENIAYSVYGTPKFFGRRSRKHCEK